MKRNLLRNRLLIGSLAAVLSLSSCMITGAEEDIILEETETELSSELFPDELIDESPEAATEELILETEFAAEAETSAVADVTIEDMVEIEAAAVGNPEEELAPFSLRPPFTRVSVCRVLDVFGALASCLSRQPRGPQPHTQPMCPTH